MNKLLAGLYIIAVLACASCAWGDDDAADNNSTLGTTPANPPVQVVHPLGWTSNGLPDPAHPSGWMPNSNPPLMQPLKSPLVPTPPTTPVLPENE